MNHSNFKFITNIRTRRPHLAACSKNLLDQLSYQITRKGKVNRYKSLKDENTCVNAFDDALLAVLTLDMTED